MKCLTEVLSCFINIYMQVSSFSSAQKKTLCSLVFALKTYTTEKTSTLHSLASGVYFYKTQRNRILKFQGFYPTKTTKRRGPCCRVAKPSRGCWTEAWFSQVPWVTLTSFHQNTELETLNRFFSVLGPFLIWARQDHNRSPLRFLQVGRRLGGEETASGWVSLFRCPPSFWPWNRAGEQTQTGMPFCQVICLAALMCFTRSVARVMNDSRRESQVKTQENGKPSMLTQVKSQEDLKHS